MDTQTAKVRGIILPPGYGCTDVVVYHLPLIGKKNPQNRYQSQRRDTAAAGPSGRTDIVPTHRKQAEVRCCAPRTAAQGSNAIHLQLSVVLVAPASSRLHARLYKRCVRRSARMSASNGWGHIVAERGKGWWWWGGGTLQEELRDESGAVGVSAHLLSSWLMIMYISQLVSSVIPP